MGPPQQALLISSVQYPVQMPLLSVFLLVSPSASIVVPIESADGSWWPSEEWICARMEGRTHGVEESDYMHADTEVRH